MKIVSIIAASMAVATASAHDEEVVAETNNKRALRGDVSVSSATTHKEVCIVGGGPSGVMAAYELSMKNVDIALFEKGESLGGKTVPYLDETTPVLFPDGRVGPLPMIRHIVSPLGMPELNEWIDKIPGFRDFALQDPRPYSFFQADNTIFNPSLPDGALDALKYYNATLTAIDATQDRVISQAGHENVPEDLMVPFLEWLENNGMGQLAPLMYNAITNFGYGQLADIPAIYLLKYTHKKLIEFFTSQVKFFSAELVVEFVSQQPEIDQTSIHTNTEVKQLRKNDGDNWNLFLKGDNANIPSFECEKVILAAPPTSNVISILQGLDVATKQLLQEVRTFIYNEVIVGNIPSSDGCSDPTQCLLGGHSYAQSPPGSSSLPNIYTRYTPNGQLRVLFSTGVDVLTPEEVYQTVSEHVQNLFGYQVGAQDMEIHAQWSYFSHVDTNAMKEGFYQKYEGIQGNQGVYFISGLNDFELVDSAFRSAQELVHKYF